MGMNKRKIGKVKGASKAKAAASQPRKLFIKFRVKPLVRMPKSVMLAKIREVCLTGIVPDDIEVAYMEYGHGRGGSYTAGKRLDADSLSEFQNLWQVVVGMEQQGTVRIERT